MRDDMRELMYASFDRELSGEERAGLDKALESSKELREEHRQLREMRTKVSVTEDMTFKPFFVEKVMEKVGALSKKEVTVFGLFLPLRAAFTRVAVGAALACLVLVFLNFRKVETAGQTAAADNAEVTMEEMFEQISYQMLEEVL